MESERKRKRNCIFLIFWAYEYPKYAEIRADFKYVEIIGKNAPKKLFAKNFFEILKPDSQETAKNLKKRVLQRFLRITLYTHFQRKT